MDGLAGSSFPYVSAYGHPARASWRERDAPGHSGQDARGTSGKALPSKQYGGPPSRDGR